MAGVNPSHVGEPNDGVAGALDDDGSHVLRSHELVEGPDQVLGLAISQAATGNIDVLGRQSIGDLADRKTERGHLTLVQVDLDLLFETARDHHRGDAFDALECPLDVLLAEESQPGELVRTVEPDTQNGVEGGIVLQEHRQFGVHRQPDTVEPVTDIEGGEVHIGIPRELESHLGYVRSRGRGHADDIVDYSDRVLDRAGQQGLDFDRRRTLVGRADRERWVGDVGQEVDRQVAEGHDPEDHRRHRKDEDRDGPSDRQVDDLHRASPLVGGEFSPPRHQERQEEPPGLSDETAVVL